jgi:hypothetical protein
MVDPSSASELLVAFPDSAAASHRRLAHLPTSFDGLGVLVLGEGGASEVTLLHKPNASQYAATSVEEIEIALPAKLSVVGEAAQKRRHCSASSMLRSDLLSRLWLPGAASPSLCPVSQSAS